MSTERDDAKYRTTVQKIVIFTAQYGTSFAATKAPSPSCNSVLLRSRARKTLPIDLTRSQFHDKHGDQIRHAFRVLNFFVVKMSPTSCIAAKASSASCKFLPLRAMQPIHAHSSRLCTNLYQQQTKKKQSNTNKRERCQLQNIPICATHVHFVPRQY